MAKSHAVAAVAVSSHALESGLVVAPLPLRRATPRAPPHGWQESHAQHLREALDARGACGLRSGTLEPRAGASSHAHGSAPFEPPVGYDADQTPLSTLLARQRATLTALGCCSEANQRILIRAYSVRAPHLPWREAGELAPLLELTPHLAQIQARLQRAQGNLHPIPISPWDAVRYLLAPHKGTTLKQRLAPAITEARDMLRTAQRQYLIALRQNLTA